MSTPLITLTATFDDLTGAAEGSVSNTSRLIIKLCNYQPTPPTIVGTAMVVRVDQSFISTTGSFSTPLWANDQISPGGTYYCISLIDAKGRTVQSANYQINAGGSAATVDLSTLTPITSQPGLLISEVPAGNYPGSSFVMSQIPFSGKLIGVYYRGVFQRPGIDYTVTGATITLTFQATADQEGNPTVSAVYTTSGTSQMPVPREVIPAGAIPGTVYTIPSTALGGVLLGLFYQGIFQRPGIDYSLSGTTITLTFTTRAGASIYAVYIPG